jgi:hypothetical protein
MMSSDQKRLDLFDLKTEPNYESRLLLEARPNVNFRRILSMGNDKILITGDVCDKPSKS